MLLSYGSYSVGGKVPLLSYFPPFIPDTAFIPSLPLPFPLYICSLLSVICIFEQTYTLEKYEQHLVYFSFSK